MLIDTHIHVGQFYNLYFAPSEIHNLMEQMCVRYYAVSSTSICEENYKKVLDEIRELIDIDGDKVLPVMWITPLGLQGNIAWYLESDIKWRMLKIHPFLNSQEWMNKPTLYAEVCDIAREMDLPILIHSGNEKCCQCFVFEEMIAANANINFILAHGRPLRQAIQLGQNYANVFIDSAFMPIKDMKRLVELGLSHKLLWGTDMCIPKYFDLTIDLETYYNNKIKSFRGCCAEEDFKKVTYENAAKLFNIEFD